MKNGEQVGNYMKLRIMCLVFNGFDHEKMCEEIGCDHENRDGLTPGMCNKPFHIPIVTILVNNCEKNCD